MYHGASVQLSEVERVKNNLPIQWSLSAGTKFYLNTMLQVVFLFQKQGPGCLFNLLLSLF